MLEVIESKIKHIEGHWIWTGARNGTRTNKFARPIMHFQGKTQHTTHVVWYITTGRFPNGQLLHKRDCNNIRCVNPDHLYEGTHQNNMDDRESFRVPIAHCKNGHPLAGKNVYQYRGLRGIKRICKTCAASRLILWRKANG